MDRRSFLKHSTFTVLALGAAPYVSAMATQSTNSAINISSANHIRHGLLGQFDLSLLNKSPIVFQLNNFEQGLNPYSSEKELKVLSLICRENNSAESIQLRINDQKVYTFSNDGDKEFNLVPNEMNIIEVSGQQVFIIPNITSTVKSKIPKNSMVMCYKGEMKIDNISVSTEAGLHIKNEIEEIEILNNNTVLVGVKLTKIKNKIA